MLTPGIVSSTFAPLPLSLGATLWLETTGTGVVRGGTSGTHTGALDNESVILANLVGTEFVRQWDDLSGVGNHFLQTNTTLQPGWLAAAENSFNLPALNCTSAYLPGAALNPAAGFSFAIVFETFNISAGARVLFASINGSGHRFTLETAASNLRCNVFNGSALGSRSQNVSLATRYVVTYTFDGASTGILRLNGVAATGTTATIGAGSSAASVIGANSNGANGASAHIAAVIVRAGAPIWDANQVVSLEAYLTAKYAP